MSTKLINPDNVKPAVVIIPVIVNDPILSQIHVHRNLIPCSCAFFQNFRIRILSCANIKFKLAFSNFCFLNEKYNIVSIFEAIIKTHF